MTTRMLSLSRSSCGAAFEVAPDMERLACGYRGASLLSERRGETVSLHVAVDAVAKAQASTDTTDYGAPGFYSEGNNHG
jgi:hypothetical protein